MEMVALYMQIYYNKDTIFMCCSSGLCCIVNMVNHNLLILLNGACIYNVINCMYTVYRTTCTTLISKSNGIINFYTCTQTACIFFFFLVT